MRRERAAARAARATGHPTAAAPAVEPRPSSFRERMAQYVLGGTASYAATSDDSPPPASPGWSPPVSPLDARYATRPPAAAAVRAQLPVHPFGAAWLAGGATGAAGGWEEAVSESPLQTALLWHTHMTPSQPPRQQHVAPSQY